MKSKHLKYEHFLFYFIFLCWVLTFKYIPAIIIIIIII